MSKTTETGTFKRLKAVMKDVDGDNRQIIKCLQGQVEYPGVSFYSFPR